MSWLGRTIGPCFVVVRVLRSSDILRNVLPGFEYRPDGGRSSGEGRDGPLFQDKG